MRLPHLLLLLVLPTVQAGVLEFLHGYIRFMQYFRV